MRVLIKYKIFGNPKDYSQYEDVEDINDIKRIVSQCIGNAYTILVRDDGLAVEISDSTSVKTEVYNQMPLLLDWILGDTHEFPKGGEYAKASI